MHPELFTIPFTNLTLKSYGLMIVIGLVMAIWLIRRLSRHINPDPNLVTNGALYALIAGVAGARLFYVIHYPDTFIENPLSFFAIWQGGLELLGGFILAITVIIIFLLYHKLDIPQHLDILAIAFMLALAFGRIGCFLSGCCFGKPANLPWAVRFPYGSDSFLSQIEPNPKRNRPKPYINPPPPDFYGYTDEKGRYYPGLKPYGKLTPEQKALVDNGSLKALPVHPTELYSSANAALISLILYLFWRRTQKNLRAPDAKKLFAKPGCTFALLFMLYSVTRSLIEFVRDDNPFEYRWWCIYKGGTISQNLAIYLFVLGIAMMIFFQKLKLKPKTASKK
jgi:phosphatidylglycerol:prolipoprotein diacylglycerol transferase